jgi:salicylate hydroxylase
MQGNTTTNGTHGANGPNGVTSPRKLRVAIIGGGIVGVAAALGLLRRNMDVRLYEQAGDFREIGAGVAFTTNAQKCMALLSPAILAAMKAVSTKNESPYYTYVDGYRRGPGQTDDDADLSETQLYRLHAGTTGFDACHRAHFLDEMVKHVPDGMVEFRKRFDTYVFDDQREEYTLRFEDGSTATADVGKSGIVPYFPPFHVISKGTPNRTQSSAATALNPSSAKSSSARTTPPPTRPSRIRSPSAG